MLIDNKKEVKMLNKNKVGLTVGLFAALCHLVWIIAVAIGVQKFVDWILLLHSIQLSMTLTSVAILNALLLIIVAFIGGYIVGWVFATIWNFVQKKAK